ncbi:MAG TPA: sugar phosphate nucleotidyltransferase [Chloroflexota bacterium]|nr:sugar phosphate nucleotidyltransferase [Chloroflexota bacterium]
MTSGVLPVVILAGGLATRLQPITTAVPKALVDVAGEPFIRHQLRLLRSNGVSEVIVCVGHLGHLIDDAVRTFPLEGLEVRVRSDGRQLLGTAGAIRAVLPLLGEAFFVLYGDSYLTCNFVDVQKAFEASGQAGLMTVFRNAGRWDRSNVEFRDGRIHTYDKSVPAPQMLHIDYGLGVLTAAAVRRVPENTPYDLAHLYNDLLRHEQLAGYEVDERFYEIGSLDGLRDTRAYFASRIGASGGGQ